LWLALGNLNNGLTNTGLSCANANNGLSNANWNIGGRHSDNQHDVSAERRLQ
jgi:hypothetical protein